MAYCKNCGANIDDKAVICPSCGATQGNPQAAADNGSFGWAVLGFFIPLAGLILWLMWKDQKPLSAKKAGMGALVSVGLNVVVFIINFIIGFAGAMG